MKRVPYALYLLSALALLLALTPTSAAQPGRGMAHPAPVEAALSASSNPWHWALTATDPLTDTLTTEPTPEPTTEPVTDTVPGPEEPLGKTDWLFSDPPLDGKDAKAGADLSTSTKTVDRAVALPGEVLTYTITLHNTGDEAALAEVTDPIPAGTTYIPDSVVNGIYITGTNEIQWSGNLEPSASLEIRFQALLDSGLEDGTVITNTATISAGTALTRTAVTNIEIEAIPNLESAIKAVQAQACVAGDILTYTITLSNTGTVTATAAITDTPPAGLEVIGDPEASTGVATYDPGNKQILWSGELPVAATACLTYTVEVSVAPTATAILTNTALIDDGYHAPFPRTATVWVPRLRLEGPSSSVHSDEVFEVALWVDNVAELGMYDASIQFPTATVEVVGVVAGSWFSPSTWITRTWDNVAGTLELAASMDGGATCSGSGVMAVIQMRALVPGLATLSFADSTLQDGAEAEVPHHELGCQVGIEARLVQGVITLQGRTVYSGTQVLADGVLVAVTAADGAYSFAAPGDQFTVTVTMPGYLWAERQVSMGASTIITLPAVQLLAGDMVGGNQEISRPITCTGSLTETIPGPQDGLVDIQDLTFLLAKVGSHDTDPWWGPDPCYELYGNGDPRNFGLAYLADINGDGQINILDLQLARLNYGRQGPSPWP